MNTKRRILIAALFLTGVLAWPLSYGFGVWDPLWISIFIALFAYVGAYWVVNFEVNTLGYVTALLPPALASFFAAYVIQTGFAGFDPGENVYLIVSVLAFFGLIHTFLTTINVINTWTFKRIALAQVAATVFLFLSLVTFYLAVYSFMVLRSVLVLAIGSVGVGGYLIFCNIWLVGGSLAHSLRLSLILAVSLLFFTLGLFFWPVPIEVYSAAISSIFFASTGITIHAKKKTLTFFVWVEYLLMLVLALSFLVATARWGIGGRL